MKISLERLYHFGCGCGKWFTIADFNFVFQGSVTCPHCGVNSLIPEQEFIELKQAQMLNTTLLDHEHPENYKLPFPHLIQQKRKLHDWTQAELAERVGLSQAAISQYELAIREPDFRSFVRLAMVLGIRMEEIGGFGTELGEECNE